MYDRVRLEVTRFKSDVLNLYRSHVESLSRLPEFQRRSPLRMLLPRMRLQPPIPLPPL